ncbi:hypothetical protein BDK92_5229 [Micromonospora pisi]|uniref:CBU-0592-like domain-containing protein n=1 Tax=Micromonospora pisi TaxID=589240 RepID=A0A495JQE2_9ACTN|nr:hypothetical protein [Micromonospora pisi]RKR90845.1 hypothetical protein BDK92_5229 [Micromonospora pisi]
MTTTDLIEVLGALLILAAFAGSQLRRMDPHSVRYLLLNTVGAGILAVLAATERSWGFLLLEGTWTIVSVISLAQALRRRPDHPSEAG